MEVYSKCLITLMHVRHACQPCMMHPGCPNVSRMGDTPSQSTCITASSTACWPRVTEPSTLYGRLSACHIVWVSMALVTPSLHSTDVQPLRRQLWTQLRTLPWWMEGMVLSGWGSTRKYMSHREHLFTSLRRCCSPNFLAAFLLFRGVIRTVSIMNSSVASTPSAIPLCRPARVSQDAFIVSPSLPSQAPCRLSLPQASVNVL